MLYRPLSRLAERMIGLHKPAEARAYRPRLSLVAGIVSAALLVLVGAVDHFLASLACPIALPLGYKEACSVARNPRVDLINAVIHQAFQEVGESAQALADTINGVVMQLLGGG